MKGLIVFSGLCLLLAGLNFLLVWPLLKDERDVWLSAALQQIPRDQYRLKITSCKCFSSHLVYVSTVATRMYLNMYLYKQTFCDQSSYCITCLRINILCKFISVILMVVIGWFVHSVKGNFTLLIYQIIKTSKNRVGKMLPLILWICMLPHGLVFGCLLTSVWANRSVTLKFKHLGQ